MSWSIPAAASLLLVLGLTLVAAFANAARTADDDAATLIVHNARIWTADPDRPEAEWIAARNGDVLALGDGDDWQRHALDGETTVIDARGRRLLPGLIDTHIHLANAGDDMRSLDLRPAASRDELLEIIAEHAATLPPDAWVFGTRWSAESWPDQRPPTAAEIDDASGGRPAVLIRMDGHSLLAGSRALEIARITSDGPPDPPGGTIGRDDTGRPTGAIFEQAMDLVMRHVERPEVDPDELLLRALREANRNGLTQVGAIEVPRAIERLAEIDQRGELTLRIAATIRGGGDAMTRWRPMLRWAADNRDISDNVRIIGFKGFMDGTLGSRTAWMTEPYDDNHMAADKDDDNAGYPLAMAATGELAELIRIGAEMNLQPAVHAIGDRANHVLLDWYASLSEEQRRELRPRIEHAQHLLPDDIERFARLGVVASMQPYHKADDGRYAEQRLGPERIRTSYAFRDLLDSGALLAFGSDWPVVTVSPFAGIHAAVTSLTLDGEEFVPEQAISVEEALVAYTRSAAAALLSEDRTGRLTPGHAADFILIDRDILEIAPEEIPQTQVNLTVMNGRVVHEAGR